MITRPSSVICGTSVSFRSFALRRRRRCKIIARLRGAAWQVGSMDEVARPRRRKRRHELPDGGPAATARALASAANARAVILVEGFSDQIALETLAARRRLDLVAEGVAIVP